MASGKACAFLCYDNKSVASGFHTFVVHREVLDGPKRENHGLPYVFNSSVPLERTGQSVLEKHGLPLEISTVAEVCLIHRSFGG